MKSPKHKSLYASTNPTNHKMCKFKQTEISLLVHKVQAGIIPKEWEVIAIGEFSETLGGGGMKLQKPQFRSIVTEYKNLNLKKR